MQKNSANISIPVGTVIGTIPEVCYSHLHYFLIIASGNWAKNLLVLFQ